MIDTCTKKPLRIQTEVPELPYIELPFSQVDDLRQLLDRQGVQYWVSEHVRSFDGGPEMAVINLRRGTNAVFLQAVLDNAC